MKILKILTHQPIRCQTLQEKQINHTAKQTLTFFVKKQTFLHGWIELRQFVECQKPIFHLFPFSWVNTLLNCWSDRLKVRCAERRETRVLLIGLYLQTSTHVTDHCSPTFPNPGVKRFINGNSFSDFTRNLVEQIFSNFFNSVFLASVRLYGF